jgi:predicted secreted protein
VPVITNILAYIVIWWITLFAVLPMWVTPTEPGEPGHDAGAPRHPRLVRKALVTTAIAAVVWLGLFLLMRSLHLGRFG